MGCFLSLFCGIQESNRRSNRLQRIRSTSHSLSENNSTDRDVFVYRADSSNFVTEDNTDNIGMLKLGIPLKRIQFKWRLIERISKEDLEQRRILFWETCEKYGGQNQVWEALKMICQENFDDLELAQSILEGCGVILPVGLLTEIYDETGFRYKLPPYCVCNPVLSDNIGSIVLSKPLESTLSTVKIRLSDGKDLTLDLEGEQLVSDLKNALTRHENLCSKQRIVVLWCGRLLDDNIQLSSLNLPKNAILQVMLP